MKEMILLKSGELVLKGLNRYSFEKVLMENIKCALKGMGNFFIRHNQATIFIEPSDGCDIDAMCERLCKVFGIVSVTRAAVLPKDLAQMLTKAPSYLEEALSTVSTFKVECKRSDKKFPYKSPEICMEMGGAILSAYPHLSVDVINPDVTVRVEVRDRDAFVYAGKLAGTGGMPTGTGGRAMLLLSGGIDSPVAGYMIGKRGVEIEAVHFCSPPYTSEKAKEKVLDLARILAGYTGKMRVHVVPFTEQQLAIRDNCPEEHLTLIMRRMMMKVAEEIAKKNRCSALITGESLGQVASQTIWALGVTNEAVSLPVFRPCIGMDKEEIVTIARKINSFETSILPYEDCCTVFTPKHPTTKPQLAKIELSESHIAMEELIQKAILETEIIDL